MWATSVVKGQNNLETYTLTMPTAGYLDVFIPPDSSVQSVAVQSGPAEWSYLGTFSMRSHRFAEIGINIFRPDVPSSIDVTLTVQRNMISFVPAGNDPLSDAVVEEAKQYHILGFINPLNSFGNLDMVDSWRGYSLLNVSRALPYSLPPTPDVNLLIITSNEIYSASPNFQSFIQYKQAQGFGTYVMDVQTIATYYAGGSIQEKTIEFLRDAFNAWHMEYVLIVGGQNTLPSIPYQHVDTVEGGTEAITTDFYYATLEQPPTYRQLQTPSFGIQPAVDPPDFVVGRIPSDSPSEVQIVLNKTLRYEQNSNPGDWINRNLLVSGQDWYPSATYTEMSRLMPSPQLQLNYPGNLTLQALVNVLNQGVGSVSVNAHGNPFVWWLDSQEMFTTADANSLTNGDKLFVVFSDGCHTGKWDTPSSLPVSLLTNPGGGAVAVVAGTDYSPYAIEVALSAYDVSKNNPFLSHRLPDADRSIGRAFYYFTALNAIVNYMNILGDPTIIIPTGHGGDTTTTTTNSTSSETTASSETATSSETTTSTITTLTSSETSTSTFSDSTSSTSVTSSSENSSSQTSSPTPPPVSNPPPRCIIATAAYGSEMAPEVVFMRHVRDNMIGSTPTGRILRDAWNTFYYSWSPPIAGVIASSSILQAVFRALLLPLVGIIRMTAFVFTTLGSGDLASVVAFTVAAGLSITAYVLIPAFAVRRVLKHP
jgi:hypothetical protein